MSQKNSIIRLSAVCHHHVGGGSLCQQASLKVKGWLLTQSWFGSTLLTNSGTSVVSVWELVHM